MASAPCPVCGARILSPCGAHVLVCDFCHYERHETAGPPAAASSGSTLTQDMDRLKHYAKGSRLYSDDITDQGMEPYGPDASKLDMIFSHMTLAFAPDLDQFFQNRFISLNKGGMIYLSTPVKRSFLNTPALEGQVNFFRSKCIMLLLEKHGFKMIWRQSRFSRILRLIAVRN